MFRQVALRNRCASS